MKSCSLLFRIFRFYRVYKKNLLLILFPNLISAAKFVCSGHLLIPTPALNPLYTYLHGSPIPLGGDNTKWYLQVLDSWGELSSWRTYESKTRNTPVYYFFIITVG